MKLETRGLTFIDKTGYIKCKGERVREGQDSVPHHTMMTTNKQTDRQADVELWPAVSDCLKGL